MKRLLTTALVVFLVSGTVVMAQNGQADKLSRKIKPLPQDLEIQLALSALPPHLRDDATVYVLNPQRGFERFHKGKNGFHALVVRTSADVYKGDWLFTEYPEDMLIPIAYDAAGAKENMRPFFDMAEMQATGVPPGEAKKIIRERYENGEYKSPERAGISYMLSPVLRAYWNPYESSAVGTVNFPHYMFYAPNVSNEDIGGSLPPATYPWAFRAGPHGYINIKAGEKEIESINNEYTQMLAELCDFKKEFCLPVQGTY